MAAGVLRSEGCRARTFLIERDLTVDDFAPTRAEERALQLPGSRAAKQPNNRHLAVEFGARFDNRTRSVPVHQDLHDGLGGRRVDVGSVNEVVFAKVPCRSTHFVGPAPRI